MSWHIIPLKFFSWNIICSGQKETIKVQFFRLLSALMKVRPIAHAIFETTRSEFIQILHPCSVSWKITPLYLVEFGQKEPIEKKKSDFWVAELMFTKFLMSYLKPQFNFSLNFASLFSVIRDLFSVDFWLKIYMIWIKEHIKVQRFRLLTAHVTFHQFILW